MKTEIVEKYAAYGPFFSNGETLLPETTTNWFSIRQADRSKYWLYHFAVDLGFVLIWRNGTWYKKPLPEVEDLKAWAMAQLILGAFDEE